MRMVILVVMMTAEEIVSKLVKRALSLNLMIWWGRATGDGDWDGQKGTFFFVCVQMSAISTSYDQQMSMAR